jgi:hypothetical protein
MGVAVERRDVGTKERYGMNDRALKEVVESEGHLFLEPVGV